jgi:hypothetical protein
MPKDEEACACRWALSACQPTKDKKGEISMKQFVITPAAGKRLIGKAIVRHAAVAVALKVGTVAYDLHKEGE